MYDVGIVRCGDVLETRPCWSRYAIYWLMWGNFSFWCIFYLYKLNAHACTHISIMSSQRKQEIENQPKIQLVTKSHIRHQKNLIYFSYHLYSINSSFNEKLKEKDGQIKTMSPRNRESIRKLFSIYSTSIAVSPLHKIVREEVLKLKLNRYVLSHVHMQHLK